MAIRYRMEKEVCVITPTGMITAEKSQELVDFNQGIISDPGIKVILFNLTETKILDSTALGALAFAYNEMLERSGRCLVCAANRHIIELLKLTQFDKKITVFATEAAALASLK